MHQNFKKLHLIESGMSFDVNIFYPAALWDEKSVCLKIESGFAFQPQKNDVYIDVFSNQSFNPDENESAILKNIFYNKPSLIFHYITFKEKFGNVEVNRMRIGYNVDVLTSVDFQGIVKIGDKVTKTFEGLIYRENVKVSPF